MGTSSKRAKDRCHKYFKVNVPIYEFLHKMTNETDGISFTCFGFQMALRKDKDETFTIHAAEFRKYSVWSYSLAWANCTLNMLLGAITIFYNVKILARATGHRRKWKCSNIALLNLAVADVTVGFVVFPSLAFFLGAALLGETRLCQPAVQMPFISLQVFLSAASFHGVVIVTIERYISVMYCMKCSIIMTRKRMVKATLAAWFVSSSLGIAAFLASTRAVQLVLSMHTISVCFILIALNIKIHLIAQAQRTRICLQRRSVHCLERRPLKKFLKIHKSVVMVIAAITLCYVPRFLISLTSFLGIRWLAKLFQPWSTTLFFAASSLNPFVYFKTLEKATISRKRAIYGAASSRYYNGNV